MTEIAERIFPVARRPRVEAPIVLAAAALAGGIAIGVVGFHTHVIRQTHIVRVEKSWGTPTQSVDGAQINRGLTGLTCDIYNGRRTVVCHP